MNVFLWLHVISIPRLWKLLEADIKRFGFDAQISQKKISYLSWNIVRQSILFRFYAEILWRVWRLGKDSFDWIRSREDLITFGSYRYSAVNFTKYPSGRCRNIEMFPALNTKTHNLQYFGTNSVKSDIILTSWFANLFRKFLLFLWYYNMKTIYFGVICVLVYMITFVDSKGAKSLAHLTWWKDIKPAKMKSR